MTIAFCGRGFARLCMNLLTVTEYHWCWGPMDSGGFVCETAVKRPKVMHWLCYVAGWLCFGPYLSSMSWMGKSTRKHSSTSSLGGCDSPMGAPWVHCSREQCFRNSRFSCLCKHIDRRFRKCLGKLLGNGVPPAAEWFGVAKDACLELDIHCLESCTWWLEEAQGDVQGEGS